MALAPRGCAHVLLLAAAALAACGGGGSTDTRTAAGQRAGHRHAAAGEVLGYVKQRLQARGPQGSGRRDSWTSRRGWTRPSPPAVHHGVARGTVVQEAGVDEDDLIKTDGRRIYTLQPLAGARGDAAAFARWASTRWEPTAARRPLGQATC
jgi:hypothetical protein